MCKGKTNTCYFFSPFFAPFPYQGGKWHVNIEGQDSVTSSFNSSHFTELVFLMGCFALGDFSGFFLQNRNLMFLQGVSKKRYFSGSCLVSALEIEFYVFTCDLESES